MECWESLEDTQYKRTLKEEALRQNTKLAGDELWTALAGSHEKEVCRVNNMYKLGDTNLTPKIGVDAGKVWNTVARQGRWISLPSHESHRLPRWMRTRHSWLARENKVQLQKIKSRNQDQSNFNIRPFS